MDIEIFYFKNMFPRLTDLENELIVPGVRGRLWGRDREFGMDMYTPLHLKWITSEDPLYSTGNSAQCYVSNSPGWEESLGDNGYTCMYGWIALLFP